MINHIVLFKFKKNVSKKIIDSLRNHFLNIKNDIPEIVSITGGRDVSVEGRNKGYDIVFIITFKSITDRDNYLPHVKHQRLVEKYINPIAEDILVFDYEIKS